MNRFKISLILPVVLTASAAFAQVQEVWVARYNDGRVISTNKPVATKLDAGGNIIVAGSSTSTNNDLDYVVLKYAPDGTPLWVNRYNSGGATRDELRALAVDQNGDVFITGSTVTVKYHSNGMLHWTAPYGGRAVTVDSNGNSYVTGFSESDFATVKLNTLGSNVWLRTYDNSGCADISQVITVDRVGNVYVAGTEGFYCGPPGYLYSRFAVLKYDPNGNQQWATNIAQTQSGLPSDFKAIAFDPTGAALYMTGNSRGAEDSKFDTFKFSTNGTRLWEYYLRNGGSHAVEAMVLDPVGFIYLTGSIITGGYPNSQYATVKLNADGVGLWTNFYTGSFISTHQAKAVAVDHFGSAYVTGFSPGQGTANDFATIKYETNGNEKWVKRYDGLVHGDDQATATAVDASGNLYVAGFSQNSSGGYDLVVIKYGELQSIQLLPNQQALLQFFGTPGTNYRFQASINLSNWVDVGSSVADTNGIYRFEDTNAPAYPHRFYRTVTP